MMAVSLPTRGFSNFDVNADEVMCIFNSEDCFQTISKEHMDHIRNTMMRHEELFKEQVQALHKLYNMQKSAMQEIRKTLGSQSQLLLFNSDTISDRNSQRHRFVLEGRPLRSADVTSGNYREEPHILSQHPIWVTKEFVGCGPKASMSMSSTELKASTSAKHRRTREIDLEKPPDEDSREIDLEKPPDEDYLEETEIQVETNDCHILEASNHLSNRSQHICQDSHVGSNFSSTLQASFRNMIQIDPRLQNMALPKSRQVSQQDHDQAHEAQETKTAEVNAPKFLSVQTLNDASNNNTLKDVMCHNLHSENFSACAKSNLSPDPCAEKPIWLDQGGLALSAQRLESSRSTMKTKQHLKVTSAQVNDGSKPIPTEVGRTIESDSITRPHLKLDEQQQRNLPDEISSPGTNSGVGNKNLESCDITCHMRENGEHKNLNVVETQVGKVLNDGNSISKIKSDLTFETDPDLPNPVSKVAVEGVNTEIEAHQFTNVDIEPSLSSSMPGFKADHMDKGNNSGCSPEIIDDLKEPTAITESNEGTESEATLEESIAAKILLSFAPGRFQDDTKEHEDQALKMAECSGSNRDAATGHERKRSLRARRTINYSDGDFIDGTVKWTKPVQDKKRRTVKRLR